MRKTELAILICVACFGIACVLSTFGSNSLILKDEVLPADLYANIIAVSMSVVALFRLVALIRVRLVPEAVQTGRMITRETIICICISVAYILGISSVGFYISTFFCIAFLYLSFENWAQERIAHGLMFSALLCGIFYISFMYMKIYLPDAWLF